MTISFRPLGARVGAASSLLCVALLGLGTRACALHVGVDRLPNGDFHVACKQELAQCLVPLSDQCPDHGYDIVQATERREATGSPPLEQTFVHSEATVHCRAGKPLFGRDPNQPVTPSVASAAAGPPRCVPGVSQACATPSGCTGAQVCVADGTHFAPCECAPPAVAPSPASSAAPAPAPDASAR
jgi:hypothetical protein